MSWHYLQAQEADSSEPICSDGDPLPPLRSKTTHAEFFCNGKLTDSYLDSLFGTMSGHSTENLGGEKLMSYQEGSHAKTSVPPEKEQASPGNDPASGVKWHALSMRYDPDTYSLRTHHCLFPEDLQLSSVTLPKWGSLHDGELWERITPVPLTSATDVGCLPMGRMIPTPNACDGAQGSTIVESRINALRDGKPLKRKDGGEYQIRLSEYVMVWPTPNARDWKSGHASESTMNRNSRPLSEVATHREKFSTPQSRDYRTGSQERYDDPARTKNLNDKIGGQLNPDWVEWLMGWPIGWTALEPITLLDWRDWSSDPGNQDVPRTINGGKERVARLKAIGNGQVPAVVQLAWRTLAHNYP